MRQALEAAMASAGGEAPAKSTKRQTGQRPRPRPSGSGPVRETPASKPSNAGPPLVPIAAVAGLLVMGALVVALRGNDQPPAVAVTPPPATQRPATTRSAPPPKPTPKPAPPRPVTEALPVTEAP